MSLRDDINNEYFEWLYNTACGERYSKDISYRKLLMLLHSTEFRWVIPMDENRASGGNDLKRRFIHSEDYDEEDLYFLNTYCSVLEMMLALAIVCEENIMDDTRYGDRTTQWFWSMLNSLGLSSMTDDRFDKRIAAETIERFLDRDYAPNGKGGLFTIKNCHRDLRDVEIWHQMCWYLDSFS